MSILRKRSKRRHSLSRGSSDRRNNCPEDGASQADSASRVQNQAADQAEGSEHLSGLSPNPATNILLAGILMRGATTLLRHTLEQGLLRANVPPKEAKKIVKGRKLGTTLMAGAASRVAMGSVPGFLAVSAGLAAKTMFDRSMSRHKAQRAAEKALAEQEKSKNN